MVNNPERFCQSGDQKWQKLEEAEEIDQGQKEGVTREEEDALIQKKGHKEEEHYGDSGDNKLTHDLRVTLININNLPETKSHPKNDLIFQALQYTQTDILLMTETGKCWHKLKEENKWQGRTRGWWESSKSTTAYNTQDICQTAYQPGGCLITSINKPSHRVLNSGIDDTKLGRWAWQRLSGKRGITLLIISAYRPCKPSTAGPNTTYSQHQRYLDVKGVDKCPRQSILDDLGTFIDSNRDAGDQIILGMDCNEDVTSESWKSWIRKRGLRNGIIPNHQESPSTYHKGSYPIDGIFVSSTITIKQSGYHPFGTFPSDHRSLWVDISYNNAFGYNMTKISIPNARRLKTSDPRIVRKFNSEYTRFIKHHKLHTKLFQIEREMSGPLTTAQAKEYDQNLSMRSKGILLAERRCRKLKMGMVPYSDELNMCRMTIELWRAVVLKKKGFKFSNNKLRRLERKTGIQNALHVNEEEAKTYESTAFQKYKQMKKTADQRRLTYLEDKANAIAQDNTSSKDNVYKQLIQREHQRSSSRRIKATIGKLRGSGVTRVEVMDDNGDIEEVITKEGIEKACMIENDAKFQQTQGTPLMQGKLASDLGYDALTPAGREVLKGTYSAPPGTSQYTRELLQHLQIQHSSTPPPPAGITSTMFRNGWKKMKEQTSAGISGLHFGHLKSCAANDFLAEYESCISHIPFASGYSPPSWQYGVNVMIRKKAQVDLVTGLRTVVLTEADFNFNNKILGKMTLQHAEVTNAIAKEQYGSRKGKRAIDHAIHKRLTYDILRQTRTPGALCSNDAKSCYDRIVHSVAMLAYQRLGIPSPPVQCMIKTIQNMKHHIRTTFGDSTFTMSNDGSLVPYQGALQGNGASPATWVVISTSLLNMMRSAGNGGTFVEPISGQISHTVGFAFVDDTDLIELDMRTNDFDTERTMQNMQETITRWEGGLKATGGAIVPMKSWVYPISFTFNAEGKWKYETTKEIGASFSVKDHNDELLPLKQHDPHIGKETLGVLLAPDGNNQAMLDTMIAKATEWKDYIQTGFLNPQDACQALHTTILKTLQYPLPALTLTEKECDKIMAPVLAAGLPAMSVCRNYPRKIVYAPKEDGGLNIPNLYITQGTSRISFLQEHIGAPTLSGELVRVTIEAAKVEIGIGRNIFQLDFDKYHILLTDTWIKEVWRFSYEQKITINDNVTRNIPLQRENDLYLMEIFSQYQFTKAELQHINRVRIHLQVTTLSDIMCGYGTNYQQAYRIQLQQGRPKRCNWPQQPKPGKRSISLWRKALRLCFPRDVDDIYTLGDWVSNGHIEKWIWYYNHKTQYLYERAGTKWRMWRRIHQRGIIGSTPVFTYYNQAIQLPSKSARATVLPLKQKQIRLTGWHNTNDKMKDTHTPYFYDYSTIRDSVQLSKEQETMLKDNICNGTLRLVSDGSFAPTLQLGSAAWVLESSDQALHITGRLITPGEAAIQCSHRSELAGLLGGINYINEKCNQLAIDRGRACMGCDGEGAIIMVSNFYEKINSSRKHFDLLGAIHKAIGISPVTWKFSHIKGHQDNYIAYNDLTREEQLNVLVDELAKQKLTCFSTTVNWRHKRPINIPYEQCSIDWTNQFGTKVRISSHLQRSLQHNIQSVRAREYWKTKKRINNYQERQIDWKLQSKSYLSLESHRHRWLSKWLTGFCGVGIMLQRYRHQNHSNCPRCGIPGETTAHIIQCQEHGARTLWALEMDKLERWMLTNQGQPEMVAIICTNLKNWQMLKDTTHQPPSDSSLILACTQQKRIGWYNFIQGYLSSQWRVCQTTHLAELKSKKSSLLWMSRFQRQLFLAVWEMWNQRNQLLHGAGDRIHLTSLRDIDTDICTEWQRGMDNLPLRYAHLFSGKKSKSLQLSPHEKQRWLTSVWAARDKMNGGLQVWDRTSDINYDKWRAKKRPQGQQNITLPQPSTLISPSPTLTVDTTIHDDDENASEDETGPGLGSSPTESYSFTKDVNELTTVIVKTSTPTPSSLRPATSPTGVPITRSPLREFISISPREKTATQNFTQQSSAHDNVVSQHRQESVSLRSLLTTLPHTWLNDEVINFYLSILTHYDLHRKEGSSDKRNHFFTSFFITRLLDEGHMNRYNYSNVRRWSRRTYGSDLFQLNRIFFPCNISQSHWSCVIVSIPDSSITYYDSMRGNGDRYMNNILHYLQDDWFRTRGFVMPEIRQWTLHNESEVPRQENSYDCGAFVCLFATCMALDLPIHFDQADAPAMRLKLAHLIYTHRISHAHNDGGNLNLVTDTQEASDQDIVICEISQDTSESSTSEMTTQAHNNPTTGYCKIMTYAQRPKRKFFSTTTTQKRKRRTSTTSQSKLKFTTATSGSKSNHQSRPADILPPIPVQRGKRKMEITDEEHPYKHKRFKEDEED